MKRLSGKVAHFYQNQVKGKGNKREAGMGLIALMLPRCSKMMGFKQYIPNRQLLSQAKGENMPRG